MEFKEAKNSFDREKLSAYCVAIANEGGGHLVLGVANTPPRPNGWQLSLSQSRQHR